MRVRALDANGDDQFGQGQANFYINDKRGVAQCVQTRLGLYTGDWFLNTADGTGWRIKILGFRTNATRDAEIRSRILGTQGVTGITAYASQLTRSTRGWAVQATIDTLYGQTAVATPTAQANEDVRYAR